MIHFFHILLKNLRSGTPTIRGDRPLIAEELPKITYVHLWLNNITGSNPGVPSPPDMLRCPDHQI